jgi:dCTP deaminase
MATERRVILSDGTIREQLDTGRIVIDPLLDGAIQPSSVDVRLASAFRVFANHRHPVIDVREEQPELTELVENPPDEPFVLHPGEFVLGATLERIALPDDIVARIEGKSSLGRLGLVIHATAGFVDAGFDGDVTLELSNVATLPILLYPGMRIAQLAFFQLDRPAQQPYGAGATGSKYQGQRGPTASRYHLNVVQPPPR